jgi:hypothetical protein
MTYQVKIFTLVDITPTNVRRAQFSNTTEYHQQQNLNVLLQTIGLRTQVFDHVATKLIDADIIGRFGDWFQEPRASVWLLKFQIEHELIWSDGVDNIVLLKSDLHGVAITSDLDNTCDFPVNIFDTIDNTNTYIVMS